jgi:protein-S-isoprenylcysteine O-methyltransferase Ste14
VTGYLQGKRYEDPRFMTPLLYKVVRHPIYLGFHGDAYRKYREHTPMLVPFTKR